MPNKVKAGKRGWHGNCCYWGRQKGKIKKKYLAKGYHSQFRHIYTCC